MRHRRSHTTTVLALAVTAAAFWSGGIGSAAEPDREAAARGSVTYRVYCGSCHGKTAKGDGKLAESLRQPPADLTLLAKNNGGVFDSDAVRETIDGRRAVAAHGDREMPVWGLVFQPHETGENAATEEANEAAVRSRLDDLVAYLGSLQAPAKD